MSKRFNRIWGWEVWDIISELYPDLIAGRTEEDLEEVLADLRYYGDAMDEQLAEDCLEAIRDEYLYA